MSDASLTMYSTPWCGYCHRLKTMLRASGISYDEVDIEQDAAAADLSARSTAEPHGSDDQVRRRVDVIISAANEIKAKLAELAG